MKNILVIGAGKSSSALIKYLLDKSESESLKLTVADISTENANKLINNHKNAKAIILDVFDKNQRENQIKKADIVVSMLPARFHLQVAKDCISFEKHMVTASYISDEMKEQVTIAKHNIDNEPNTPTKYGVRGIPTMLLFKDGELKSTKVGATPKSDIVAWIKENI